MGNDEAYTSVPATRTFQVCFVPACPRCHCALGPLRVAGLCEPCALAWCALYAQLQPGDRAVVEAMVRDAAARLPFEDGHS